VLSVNVLNETDPVKACVNRMQRSAFYDGDYMKSERRFQQQTHRSVHPIHAVASNCSHSFLAGLIIIN